MRPGFPSLLLMALLLLPQARAGEAPIGDPTLSVLTWNLLFKGGFPRISLKAIRGHPADIIAVQEFTPAWQRRLDQQLGRSHRHSALKPNQATHGFGLYSVHPLADVEYLTNHRKQAFAQCARVAHPTRPFCLCNAHLASPARALAKPEQFLKRMRNNAAVREAQWDRMIQTLTRAEGCSGRWLVVGDLNTPDAGGLYRKMTQTFTDAYAATNKASGATFPNLVALPPFPVVRIDYVLTGGRLAPISAQVLPDSGSDHLAVKAKVQLLPDQATTQKNH